jgi:hypothetical protein
MRESAIWEAPSFITGRGASTGTVSEKGIQQGSTIASGSDTGSEGED